MFPYIKKIIVNDCYASQNFEIEISDDTSFKHLILTGKNGSGKTTILNRLRTHLILLTYNQKGKKTERLAINLIKGILKNLSENITEKEVSKELSDIEVKCINDSYSQLYEERNISIYTYFQAQRKIKLNDVTTVTKESVT